jgi:hypothetical protein
MRAGAPERLPVPPAAFQEIELAVDPQTILGWLRRLAAFDAKVFDDVRSNPTATLPAVALAVLSFFLSGIGGWLWWSIPQGYGGKSTVFVDSAVIGSLIALALWGVVWVGLVYFFLTQFFRQRVFLEQLLRVMGLATAPLGLTLLMVVPHVSFAAGLISLVLTFALSNVAIQSVTAADPLRVLAANLGGFGIWAVSLTFFVSSSHVYAPGVFVYVFPAEAVSDLYGISSQFKNLVQ